MNAVTYIRAHGEMKGTEVTQMTMVNNLVQQLNATVVGHFISNDEIPVGDLLLRIQETNTKFDTIFTLNKDVISTKLQEVYSFVTGCSSQGIAVHTFGDGNLTDFFNSVGRFKAQKDKEKISKLTTERMARLAVTGRQLGGRVPFGYRIGAGRTEIDKEKALIVREIFLHFAQGLSPKTISRIIAEKYGLNYGEKGNWRQSKILDMLINPMYNGYPAWKKTTTEDGKFKRLPREEWILSEKQIPEFIIIDDVLWNTVQNRLKDIQQYNV